MTRLYGDEFDGAGDWAEDDSSERLPMALHSTKPQPVAWAMDTGRYRRRNYALASALVLSISALATAVWLIARWME